jgi:hypothetical protein
MTTKTNQYFAKIKSIVHKMAYCEYVCVCVCVCVCWCVLALNNYIFIFGIIQFAYKFDKSERRIKCK